jgi:hypothetical protein
METKFFKCTNPHCKYNIENDDNEFVLTEAEFPEKNNTGKYICPTNPNNSDCGLIEIDPSTLKGTGTKSPINIKLIAAIAAGVLLIGGLVFYFVGGSSDKAETAEVTTTDTAATAPQAVEEPAITEVPTTPEVVATPEPVKPAPTANNTGNEAKVSGGSASKGTQSLSIGGNTYKGEVLNGKPHGMGTMYYKSSTQISPKDLKKRMAEAGDYITGEFFEGNVVQGKLFDADNNVKEVIMIGR